MEHLFSEAAKKDREVSARAEHAGDDSSNKSLLRFISALIHEENLERVKGKWCSETQSTALLCPLLRLTVNAILASHFLSE